MEPFFKVSIKNTDVCQHKSVTHGVENDSIQLENIMTVSVINKNLKQQRKTIK